MSGLDHTAARALREMVAAGGPSIADLSPDAARRQYLAGYAQLQAPQQDVAQIREDRRGPCRLKIWRGLGAPADMAPGLIYVHGGGWVIGAQIARGNLPPYRQSGPGCGDCARLPACPRRALSRRRRGLRRRLPRHSRPGGGFRPRSRTHRRGRGQRGRKSGRGDGPDGAGRDDSPGDRAAAVYPNTDQTQSGDSFRQFAEGYGLSAREMAWFRRHYLPDMRAYDDWRAAPLRAPSLAGVAPAIVVLAGQDVLYSEGAAYAARLAAESHAVIREWPGQIHGFISMSALIPQAAEAVAWACKQWVSVTV